MTIEVYARASNNTENTHKHKSGAITRSALNYYSRSCEKGGREET